VEGVDGLPIISGERDMQCRPAATGRGGRRDLGLRDIAPRDAKADVIQHWGLPQTRR
jgi:hypothetical protein